MDQFYYIRVVQVLTPYGWVNHKWNITVVPEEYESPKVRVMTLDVTFECYREALEYLREAVA